MRFHKHVVSTVTAIAACASAALLACALSAPAPAVLAAYAASGEADSARGVSAGASSEADAEGSDAASTGAQAAEEPEAGTSAAASSAGGSTASASEDKKSGSKSAQKSAGSKKSGASKSSGGAGKSASASSGKSAKSAKSSKNSKSAKKAKSSKEKAAAKKKAAKKKAAKKAAKYARRLAGLADQLQAVPDGLGEAEDVERVYKKKLAKLKKKLAKLEEERERAQNVLDEMQSELTAGPGEAIERVLAGQADLGSIDARAYLLQKVADSSSARVAELDAQIAELEQREEALEKREAADMKAALKDHEEELERVVAQGNAIAAKIEKNVSLMEYAETDLSKSRAALRESSLAAAARWYEFEDALAGEKDVLTFGAGADFRLSEKAFVKKWGAAIDAFYANTCPDAPLEGHGAEMAQAAWDHKIDPRLCAAVSIVESTGGQYCIKPYNAWGWGAADSDPYGGASAWDSWEGAIEAWHEGMAESTTGLATAPTVVELGETYCSSLDWAAEVSAAMEQIGAEAD